MRTRRSGGGTCTTTYCTRESLHTIASRIKAEYLKSIGVSANEEDLEVKKKYLDELTKDKLMPFVKNDCLLKRGFIPCLDLYGKTTTHNWVATGHKTKLATSTKYAERISFEEIVDLAHKWLTNFLSGKSGGSKRKRTKKCLSMLGKR